MARRYFGTDGIRGQSNVFPMTPDLAMRVGIAVGTIFRRGHHRHRVVIGKDTRLSGYMLENALVAGFTAAGLDVFLLGPIPTPAVAMLTRSLRADIGVMISASHNPFSDNGIKLFGPDGYKLSDELELEIEDLLDKDIYAQLAKPAEIGRAKRVDGDIYRYIEFVKRTLPRDVTLSGLRIAIDCANGAAYKVAPAALWELGAEVVTIGNEPNGININLECGSTHPEALQKKLHEVRADIGIALDGDADRVIIVDERGEIVDGDQLMAVIADSWAADNTLRGGGIVATVMSISVWNVSSAIRASPLPAPRLATAMSSSICATTISTSAVSSPAISCFRITVRREMVWWRPCRFSPRSSAPASRSAKCVASSSPCRSF